MRSLLRLAIGCAGALVAGACSSSNTFYGSNPNDGGADAVVEVDGDASAGDAATKDGGGKSDGTASGSEVNPYGVPYPTGNLGTNARAGSKPGNVIRNHKFQGYVFENGTLDTSALREIKLADYYDPQGQLGYKVLHIFGAAIWATPSETEMHDIVAATSAVAAKGGVFLAILGEGLQPGVKSQEIDLKNWASIDKPKFSIALDPAWKELGNYFDAAAVPLNMNIDARSMEILSSGVGMPPDIEADVTTWVDWTDTHPPASL
jgi:hypothetical protein